MLAIALLSAAVAEAPEDRSVRRCRPLPSGAATEDLARVLQLTGASPVRPLLFRSWSNLDGGDTCAGERAPPPNEVPHAPFDAFELQLLPLEFRNYLNTAYPDDRNDGALWESRGLATALSGGARVRWKFVSAAVAPLVAWQQNRDFFYPQDDHARLFAVREPVQLRPDRSAASLRPHLVLDRRSRPELRARRPLQRRGRHFHREPLVGSGHPHSILMTNSGPGFPHWFVGTSRPQDIWIGWPEVQLLWGRLTQSD